VVCVGAIIGHTNHCHDSDCWLPAERHWLWPSGPFQLTEQWEIEHVQKIRLLYSFSRNVVIFCFRLSVVYRQRSAAGDIYSDLDSIDLRLWHLLQAVRIDGKKIVMDFILITGIAAFVLLAIGLALTYSEFDKFD
jgi:hypothetical protein